MKRNCNCNVIIKSGEKNCTNLLPEIGATTTKSLYCYLILMLNKIKISIEQLLTFHIELAQMKKQAKGVLIKHTVE